MNTVFSHLNIFEKKIRTNDRKRKRKAHAHSMLVRQIKRNIQHNSISHRFQVWARSLFVYRLGIWRMSWNKRRYCIFDTQISSRISMTEIGYFVCILMVYFRFFFWNFHAKHIHNLIQCIWCSSDMYSFQSIHDVDEDYTLI